MEKQKNFLIGNGEQLINIVPISRRGGEKRKPYSFEDAKDRLTYKLENIGAELKSLPREAVPQNNTVISFTLHPRFVSKSDHPEDFFKRFKLQPIGSKSDYIKPENWGVNKQPSDGSLTDTYFVKASINELEYLTSILPNMQSNRINDIICYIEDISLQSLEEKFQGQLNDFQEEEKNLFECVLHDGLDQKIHDDFYAYLRLHESISFNSNKTRKVEGLTFVPIFAYNQELEFIGKFTFLRALRAMPKLRPFRPNLLREIFSAKIDFDDVPIFDDLKAVIFDGGLPLEFIEKNFVDYIELPNIGNPVDEYIEHGLAVTGVYLFGSLDDPNNFEKLKPLSNVTHVRVLGENHKNPSSIEDLDLYDVIDNIVLYLEENVPDLANLSLGPDSSIDDNEITYWTAKLDKFAAEYPTLITVAAGNNGESSDLGNLNRIQIPSDAVNVIGVGATDQKGVSWDRASYSALGPGRNPGIIKPDVVCFGGSAIEPFKILALHSGAFTISQSTGTSFASPLVMRQAATIYGNFKKEINLLSVRAIIIHQAQDNDKETKSVGWGKCSDNTEDLVTCDDNEVTIIYSGKLEVNMYTRIPLPLENITFDGKIEIRTTLLTKTDIDPNFAASYTKFGSEIIFRPVSTNISSNSKLQYAKSASFFDNRLSPIVSETIQKANGAKWESVRRMTKTLKKCHEPVYDIVSHHRSEGKDDEIKYPIEFSCVISVKTKKEIDLYNQVIRQYQGILLPLSPRLNIQIRT